jgi:hypothetical protein
LELERTMRLAGTVGRRVVKETHPFNRPAEDSGLEVFRLGKLATLSLPPGTL